MKKHTANIIIGLFMFIGIGIRLFQYFSNHFLWFDEAALALNIIERDFQGLLSPLDYGQAAPVGFLMVSKFNTVLFGTHEYVLRFYPLLLGIISILLIYLVTKRISERAVPFALLMIAPSFIFIRYSTEFKQYSGDATYSLLLWLIAIRMRTNYTLKALAIWSFVGAVVVWFSHPSVFVIAGIGLVLLFELFRAKEWRKFRNLAIASSLPALSFLIVYFSFYNSVVQGTELSTIMQNYWQDHFLKPSLLSFILLVFHIFAQISNTIPLFIFVITAFIIGVRRLKFSYTAILLAPTLVAMIASLLLLYPLRERLILFMLPAFIIIAAHGFQDFFWQLQNFNRRVAYIAFGFLALGFLAQINVPQSSYDERDMLQFISSSMKIPKAFVTIDLLYSARYYEIPSELISQEVIPQSSEHDSAVWLIYGDYKFEQTAREGLENADLTFKMEGLRIYCFNGQEEACVAPPFISLNQN